jgi:large subunit ribosomal protein L10
MKLTRQGKQEKASSYAKELEGAGLFFSAYQGMKFKELEDLRVKLKPANGKIRVVKNSIALHALKAVGVDSPQVAELLAGPTALSAVKGDEAITAAKVLVNFSKDNQNFKIKAAFVDGKWLTSEQVTALSKIGSRLELLTQLAGLLQQPTQLIASVLQAPMRDFAYAVKAVEEKKKQQPA